MEQVQDLHKSAREMHRLLDKFLIADGQDPTIPSKNKQISSKKPKKESGLSTPKRHKDRKTIPMSTVMIGEQKASLDAPKEYMGKKPIPAISYENRQIFSENNEIEGGPMSTNK